MKEAVMCTAGKELHCDRELDNRSNCYAVAVTEVEIIYN